MMNSDQILKHEKSCGGVIFCEFSDGLKVLLLKHRLGHWDFPKGHTRKRETETQTALREIKEESGLNVSLQKGFRNTICYSPLPGIEKEVVFFLGSCTVDESGHIQPQPSEIAEASFVPVDRAEALITFPSGKKVFRAALKAWLELRLKAN